MKRKIIQKIACFTAAVVVANTLAAGNIMPAAAMLQVHAENENAESGNAGHTETAEGTAAAVPQIKTVDGTAAAGADGEKKAGTDPSEHAGRTEEANGAGQPEADGAGRHEAPKDADNSDAAGSAGEISEISPAGNPDGTDPAGEANGTDAAGSPNGTDTAGNPDGTDAAGNPDGTDPAGEADGTDAAGSPDGTDPAGEANGTDAAGSPDGTDAVENPDGTDQTEKPDEPDSIEKPDESDSTEKPEKAKLKKPVLKASSKPDGIIKLKWNKVNGAAEYVLQCSTKKDSGFHSIYETKKGAASYMHSGRAAGKVYYYRLAVFSKGRESRADSKVVSGRSLGQVKLTGISNVSGSRSLVIQWQPVEGAGRYQVKRKNLSTGKYETAGSVAGIKTTFTDKNRIGGTVYTYCVCAYDKAGGRGKYSASMSQMAIDKDKKMIALTYDDGPSANTPVVLDALAKNGAHATFFVVGNQVDRYADSIRRAVSLGCEIGNHTYDHSNLKNLSAVQVQAVLGRTVQAVKNQSGYDVQLVRPPYGSYNSAVGTAAGEPIIMWSIDTLDWKTRSTSATIQCVQQKAYDGAVVLMHDLHRPTALAADTIIKSLKNAGYQLVTVSEMAAYRGGLRNGAAYSQFRK